MLGNTHCESIGTSPKFTTALRQAETVAPADCAVLILVETGTGKELFAWAIHEQSLRRSGTFVKINCAGMTLAGQDGIDFLAQCGAAGITLVNCAPCVR